MRGARPAARAATAALLLAPFLLPPSARAHGTPIQLAFWGDFPLPVARCQRVVGRAAAACGMRVWRARRDCALARLRGAACDPDAVDAATDAARRAAIDDVSAQCTPQHLAMLQFLDVREAQADVVRFCRELDAAMSSLVLEPLDATPAPATACGAHATWAATHLLANAFRGRQRLLDRIAASAVAGADKLRLVDASTARIGQLVARLADALPPDCPPERFRSTLGRDAAPLLAAVAGRADCLAGDAYAQGAILCPPAVCGNRIREGTEGCDDGNRAPGDGCDAECRREAVTSDSRS